MGNWAEKAVFYHIYPLGFCGAPKDHADESSKHSILKVKDWIEHLKELGITAVYFGPVFESDSHGYDTTDYYKIDTRLGTNEDFKEVSDALHQAGIKVVLDGVFNHVGRGFFAFKDVQEKKSASAYKDWFVNVHFDGDSPYHDGFSYEGWEGHYNLVKLNLWNMEVRKYLFGAIEMWIKTFQIDGLRLDVAYCIEESFLDELRKVTDRLAQEAQKDFWLMGEMIHGDYNRLLKPNMLHSVTDYECYKGIYSSHNDKNYFEINYSMNRLFARGGLYEGKHLYNFVDNHDVSRIVSILKEPRCIFNVYTLLFTMPGIPSIYYGGEWQIEGKKEQGSDESLRPEIDLEAMKTKDTALMEHLKKLAALKRNYELLSTGLYEQVVVKNEQLIFARTMNDEKIYVALNLSPEPANLSFSTAAGEKKLVDLLTGEAISIENNKCQVQLDGFCGKVLFNEDKVKEL